jgi:hypothetical protein
VRDTTTGAFVRTIELGPAAGKARIFFRLLSNEEGDQERQAHPTLRRNPELALNLESLQDLPGNCERWLLEARFVTFSVETQAQETLRPAGLEVARVEERVARVLPHGYVTQTLNMLAASTSLAKLGTEHLLTDTSDRMHDQQDANVIGNFRVPLAVR